MTRNLPPLGTLRAYEAAATHESFAKAADELRVTRGAVSQQVQALEGSLGVPLFRRRHRGISLNRRGQQYFAAVAKALQELEMATAALRPAEKSNLLKVRTLPALAEKWVMPRLQHFLQNGTIQKVTPGVKIELCADDSPVDLRRPMPMSG
jgi:LysR family glycine cleavage system transcriptional activator